MIRTANNFRWTGVEEESYKDQPGTWMSVTRQVLSKGIKDGFEVRYFEISPGGYSSFEKHNHEHCVIVLRGAGEVRIGDDWRQVGEHDVVIVPGNTPHQFANRCEAPFGILCVVDRDRDRPTIIDSGRTVKSSKSETSKC